jgi:hypothetical protein
MTPEQIKEIRDRADRLEFLVHLGEAAANGRIIEVELKQKADFVDLGQLIGTAVPALIGEVERLTAELSVAFGPGMYLDIQKVLDEALGTHEADGAGAGIAADVAVLAEQKRTAETEVKRLRTALKDAADQVAASDIDAANTAVDLDQTKARVRALLASMRAAVSSGDHATLAFNIGQIAVHVDAEVDAR